MAESPPPHPQWQGTVRTRDVELANVSRPHRSLRGPHTQRPRAEPASQGTVRVVAPAGRRIASGLGGSAYSGDRHRHPWAGRRWRPPADRPPPRRSASRGRFAAVDGTAPGSPSRPPVGQQPVVPDLHEPARQHVLHEPPQELLAVQRHRLRRLPRRRSPCTRTSPGRRPRHQPAVADRHPVRVPGQVLQHLRRPAERRLGVHHPVRRRTAASSNRRERRGSASGASRPRSRSGRGRAPAAGRQELAAEHAAQHPHRQEEPRPARDPAG